ncbi:MAG: hypothetical protein K8S54_07965 [Spirochaetia bacterium]|nr:hypothetical protein [Spirochaetia bacterium]
MDQADSPSEEQIRARKGVNPDPLQGRGRAAVPDAYANHDAQIRNHLSSLVRTMLQDGKKAQLREALHLHRGFIDEILVLLDSQK